MTTRTEIPTIVIECSCRHCKTYAAKQGLELPLRAEVNEKMAAAICTDAKGRHVMVKEAHQPPFGGRMSPNQLRFGPWVAA